MSEDIMRKIAALMAKANGTENEHEAAAFAAKAHAMLAEHNLSLTDVLKYGAAKAGDAVGKTPHSNKYVGGWRSSLMNSVAAYYFCKLVISHEYDAATGKNRKCFLLIGKTHNVAVAVSMFDYLEKTTVRLGREWMRSDAGSRSEQLNFEKGCGLRIAARLDRLRYEAAELAKAAPQGPSGGLPALYNQEAAAIQAFVEANMQLGKAHASKMRLQGRGAIAGRAAGDGVGLHTQVGADRQRNKLLS